MTGKKTEEIKPNGKIHPLAAIWPKLSEEDMAALAESIKSHGLREPIVLDKDGTLIDGVNRQEACKIADVEPRYEILNSDQDITAFIFDRNATRRHMKKGQIAMVAVKAEGLRLEAEGKKSSMTDDFPYGTNARLTKLAGCGQPLISDAILVYRYARELVDEVITGLNPDMNLGKAVAIAKPREQDANSGERQLQRLREQAPDLAQQVTEERLKFSEAWAVIAQRKKEQQEYRDSITRQLSTVISFLNPRAFTVAERIEYIVRGFDEKRADEECDAGTLIDCLSVMEGVVKELKEKVYVAKKGDSRAVG
jgi:ParB-like nuclease domain